MCFQKMHSPPLHLHSFGGLGLSKTNRSTVNHTKQALEGKSNLCTALLLSVQLKPIRTTANAVSWQNYPRLNICCSVSVETRINCLESKSYEKSKLRSFPFFGVLTACFNSFQFYLHTVSYSAIELYTAKQQPFFHRPPNRDPLWLFRGCIVCAIPLLPALMSLVCVCALSVLHGS